MRRRRVTSLDESTRRGKIHSAGSANLDAFTDTRRVSIRGEFAPYPF